MPWSERLIIILAITVGISVSGTMLVSGPTHDQRRYLDKLERTKELLANNPNNPRLLFDYAYDLHQVGRFEEALEAHLVAAEHPRFRATAYYNAGCAASLLGWHDDAMVYLTRAVIEGYTDHAHWARDPDLNPLLFREDFQALLWSIGPRNGSPPHAQPHPGPGGWF